MRTIPVALQLYTVRDMAAKDFVGTLKQVAAIGYPGVELGGMYGLQAAELKRVLDDLGLKVVGSHVRLADLENDLPRVLEETRILENRYIVVPSVPEERRKTSEDWLKLAQQLTALGIQCHTAGFQLCYHNHAFEFQRFGGQTAHDLLFSHADPDALHAELDVYWARFAGVDPAPIIRRLAGRIPLIHLKDMTASDPPTFAEIGEGIIDFAPIFEASQASGVLWYVVEQDKCQRPSLESARISWQNLKRLLA